MTMTETYECARCGRPYGTDDEAFWCDCPLVATDFRTGLGDGREVAGPANDQRSGAERHYGNGNGGGHRTAEPVKMASDKQIGFIRKLQAERQAGVVDDLKTYTSREASRYIDELLAMPVREAPQAPEEACNEQPAPKARTNRFGGRCGNCGRWVEAEAGTLERIDDRWQVWHAEGECPSVGEFGFPEGRYAVATDEGARNEIAFYHCFKGVVSLQTGFDLTPLARKTAETVVAKIAADPEAAMRRYGIELGRCGRCNRELTNDESRAYGVGPVCRALGF